MSFNFSTGIKFGWTSYGLHGGRKNARDVGYRTKAGPNQSIYGSGDNGNVVDVYTGSDEGKTINVMYPYNSEYNLIVSHSHCNSIDLGIGNRVDHTTKIANMGTTGKSTGHHSHLRTLLWPTKTQYSRSGFYGSVGKSIDPADILANPTNEGYEWASPASGVRDFSKVDKINYISLNTNSVISKIEVITKSNLRVRESASISSKQIGRIDYNTQHNIVELSYSEGYEWGKLVGGGFVAIRKVDNSEKFAKFISSSKSGTATALINIKIRKTPGLSGKHISVKYANQKFDYNSLIIKDGYEWCRLSDETGFVAIRSTDNKEIFAKIS